MVAVYYECGTCSKGFNTGHDAGYNARNNHCISKGHVAPSFECDTCPENFKSEAARLRHMQVEGHRSSGGDDMDWECGVCDRFLDTEADREAHEIAEHFYCGECERTFSALHNIKQHRRSNAHSGHIARCPLCAKTDCNVGAITKHLETGFCSLLPGMNRDKMHKLVRSKDPVNRISRRSIFNRTVKAGVTHVANEASWNGKGYACYLCDHAFRDLQSLNSHLNSSKHDEDLYHCPTADCKATFKTLTAAIAHLESDRHDTNQQKLEKFLLNVVSK